MAGPSAEMHGSVFFLGLGLAYMAFNKPFYDLAQQIALLQQRGMLISNNQKATDCLARIGYYRLSGYWFPFRQANAAGMLEAFKANTRLETVVDLYIFDKNLRLLLLDAIERIEIALRVHVSLLLGKYGPQSHRDPTILDGKFARQRSPKTGLILHQEWLKRIDSEFDRSKEEFAKHFKAKYPGEYPPIWISCEVWDFGALSYLISGLKPADRLTIAQAFGLPTADVLESWVRAINVSRNVCAHHSRLWNRANPIQPKWPSAAAVPDLAHIDGDVKAQTRLYGMAVILRYLLRKVNPATSWSDRLKGICGTFPADGSLSLTSAGFPANWENQSLWS